MSQIVDPVKTTPLLPAATRWGAARIAVTDRERALAIWRDIVGLKLLSEDEATLTLGVDTTPIIVLEFGATNAAVPRAPGLYHLAIHVPTRTAFADFAHRCIVAGIRMAPTDHLVSEAIYIWDLDKNGIELTFETPWRGDVAEFGSGVYVRTKQGDPHSGREPIDLDNLLADISAPTPPNLLPKGTRLGHIHLHVDNLDAAMNFYRDIIGFGGVMMMPEWGMGDAGLGYMPHAIAFNVWAKPTKMPVGEAGLRHITLVVPTQNDLNQITARLSTKGHPFLPQKNGIETNDPAGNRLHILF